MRPPGRLVAGLCAVWIAACSKSSPLAPAAPTPTPSTPSVAAVFLTPNSWDMPVGGGVLEIVIATAANETGSAIAPNVRVTLRASSGVLSNETPQTDRSGHATVSWSGASSAIITARAGEVEGTATIRVPAVTPTPTPTPTPPSPIPNPEPTPTPTPRPPTPGPTNPQPAGDLVATITANPSAPDANQNVTLSAALSSTTGAAVPAIVKYVWDVDNDRLPDHFEASPVVSYSAGTQNILLTVLTADNREVNTALALVVLPTPALRATLSASPATVGPNETVTLTAFATTTGITGTLSYAWDFDGNGTIDFGPVAGNMATTSYATVGTKTAKVTVTGSRAGSATASTSVNVTGPALSISSLTVSGSTTAGSQLTFTATISAASGPVPSPLTFKWDFGNGSEIVTSPSPQSINHTYASAGTYKVTVTATASDGRTATATITVVVI